MMSNSNIDTNDSGCIVLVFYYFSLLIYYALMLSIPGGPEQLPKHIIHIYQMGVYYPLVLLICCVIVIYRLFRNKTAGWYPYIPIIYFLVFFVLFVVFVLSRMK